MRWCWLTVGVLLGVLACSPPSVTQVALSGDLATLKREIAAAQRAETLSKDVAVELAQAVARREIRSAQGADAAERLRSIGGCVGSVSDELQRRAEAEDPPAAVATLLLAEAGYLSLPELVSKHQKAMDGAWRAVAARAAVGRRYGTLRRKLIADGDQRVRRAALRAALANPVPADRDALAEAARLDPDPMSRTFAVHALGALGGSQAALTLRDLWPQAAEAERVVLVEGWSRSATFESGGEAELLWVIETQTGMPALAAAIELAKAAQPPASEAAEARLVHAIDDGPSDERRMAIRLAPDPPAIRTAIEKAATAEDPQVRVLALARLVGIPSVSPQDHDKYRAALRQLAKGRGDVPRQARATLAQLGDASVSPALRKQLSARRSRLRQIAAFDLLRLGDYSSAATALGDDSPTVRIRVACRMLGNDSLTVSK